MAHLTEEVKRHFAVIGEKGSRLKEAYEIAPGIMVAIDEKDGTFIFYFLRSAASFRGDNLSLVLSEEDETGMPVGCSPEVMAFICGKGRPESIRSVIDAARSRLCSANCADIRWHNEPQVVIL